MSYDFNKPFITVDQMDIFKARRANVAKRYGLKVLAISITNREYKYRYAKFAGERQMKPPPGSTVHICPGYLVVRRLGTQQEYETWMPDSAFEADYILVENRYSAPPTQSPNAMSDE
jgi:hypothetical protein